MKRSLLIATLLIVSTINLFAQGLFTAPDTVCVRQPVYLKNNDTAGSTYYWGFCSGYLVNDPVGNNLGTFAGIDNPGAIDIAKYNGNFYGFVASRNTDELIKLDFGNSLGNIPTVTNLGTLNNTVPHHTNSLHITQDTSGKWFMFACGGETAADASLARFDFEDDLSKVPNSVNFGNPGEKLINPRGLTIDYDRTSFNYYGYMVDSGATDQIIQLNFGNSLWLTPIVNPFSNPNNVLAGPSDLESVFENGNWYLVGTNQRSSEMFVFSMGSTLAAPPTLGINIGNVGSNLFEPSSLEIIKDCGSMYAFVSNALNSTLTKVVIPDISLPFTSSSLGAVGGLFIPNSLSTIIRDRDSLSMFATNVLDNSISHILFPQCTNASRASDTAIAPKSYTYDEPGIYNVYLAVNEGQSDMQMECQQIVVLPRPKVLLSNDTVICQGDTIQLFSQSGNAIRYAWSPDYNISDTSKFDPYVFPEYTLDYYLNIYYANGCIVDTSVNVEVKKVKADAGPDRTIADGATTVLGGPLTSMPDSRYFYQWFPPTYLNGVLERTPTATPMQDMTYYLYVSLNDPLGCSDIDTVVVHTTCADINLPNAFVPVDGSGGSRTFGLLNKQIVKLNYFRVYDRWGSIVFSTTDPTKQWDGTIDGNKAPMGVYIWEADGFCYSGNRVQGKGNVTLIR